MTHFDPDGVLEADADDFAALVDAVQERRAITFVLPEARLSYGAAFEVRLTVNDYRLDDPRLFVTAIFSLKLPDVGWRMRSGHLSLADLAARQRNATAAANGMLGDLASRDLEGVVGERFSEGLQRAFAALTLSAKSAGDQDSQVRPLFSTAADLCDAEPDDDVFVARFFGRAAVTELVGKVKAAGKTTYLLASFRAITTGTPFLGHPVAQGPVVYLSEQSGPSLAAALRRAGLDDSRDLYILPFSKASRVPWPSLVEQAVGLCREVGAVLLGVDTLSRWARLEGDDENSAGASLAIMQPLRDAAAEGLAVVVSRHERKSGGSPGDSGRGSSALSGEVDTIIQLRRADGGDPNLRVLEVLSRFDDLNRAHTVRWEGGGDYSIVDPSSTGERLRDLVVAALRSVTEGLTADELAGRVGQARTSIRAALDELRADDLVTRTGGGRKGDPYRFVSCKAANLGVLQECTNFPGPADGSDGPEDVYCKGAKPYGSQESQEPGGRIVELDFTGAPPAQGPSAFKDATEEVLA